MIMKKWILVQKYGITKIFRDTINITAIRIMLQKHLLKQINNEHHSKGQVTLTREEIINNYGIKWRKWRCNLFRASKDYKLKPI